MIFNVLAVINIVFNVIFGITLTLISVSITKNLKKKKNLNNAHPKR